MDLFTVQSPLMMEPLCAERAVMCVRQTGPCFSVKWLSLFLLSSVPQALSYLSRTLLQTHTQIHTYRHIGPNDQVAHYSNVTADEVQCWKTHF